MLSGGDSKKDGRAEVRRSKTEDEGAGGSRTPKSATADGGGMRFFVGESVKHQIPNPSRPPPPSRAAATASSARRRKATQAVSTARRDVRTARRGSRRKPKKHSTTAGGTTLSLCPFPAGRQAVAAASSHPHALRNRKPKACSTIESLQASRCLL